ncbi:MAG TPA: pitrilysin family protein [Vicinamibacterales bacterium]|nr:pitrilysin family protein [Vicinamibacterales bacterium]
MSIAQAGLNPVRAVLANGVRVIAKQARVTPAVTIHVAVHGGTVADPPGLPGVAYFLSRMIDRGTASLTADQIAESLESRGVSLAVNVTKHSLSLVSTCLVEDFTDVLGIVADCLMHPVFPEAEIVTRRGEMITFIRQDDDNPAAVAMNGLMELLYGNGHPYGWPTRGTVASAGQIGRAELIDFHSRRATPASTVIAIVGDVDPAAATGACADAFGVWPSGPPTPVALPEPAPSSSRRGRVLPMMSKAQADITYGFTSIRRHDPEYYAYWLMNNIFGQYSLGGRLGDNIRERQGMAYYIMSALDATVIAGPLVVRAGVATTNVERAIAAIDDEVRTLAAEGPTEKELRESKQYLIGSLPRTLETNLGIAGFLQTAEFFGLGLDYDQRLPSLLQAVTRDDVHAAARRTLDPSRATVVVAGPYDRTPA